MNGPPLISGKNRAFLKKEMTAWVAEGIITEDGARRLTDRCGLDAPGRDAGKLLSSVILGAAGLLLGCGVCALVAANWEIIPAWMKITALYAILFSCHFKAWQFLRTPGRERMGHGLALCGCFVFGAGIILMAQIFHITSESSIVYAWWAAGCLAAAWALPSAFIGYLALGASIFWFLIDRRPFNDSSLLLNYYPLIVMGAVLPLAVVRQARGLFVTALATAMGALALNGSGMAGPMSSAFGLLGLLAAVLLAWAGGQFFVSTPAARDFSQPASVAGLAGLAAAAYVWSFHRVWQHGEFDDRVRDITHWLVPVIIIAASGAAALVTAWRRNPPDSRELRYRLAVLAVFCLLAAAGLGAAANMRGMRVIGPLVSNIAALILIAAVLTSGLSEARRGSFWFGTLFLVLLILSRFFEYETGLIAKSMAFIACGVITLYAGIEYERHLKRRETPRE